MPVTVRLSVIAVLLLALASASCGGSDATPVANQQFAAPTVLASAPLAWSTQMPAFPGAGDAIRTGSEAQSIAVQGSDELEKSSGAIENAPMLEIPAGTGTLEYGMYQFATGFAPLTFELDVTVGQENAFWLAFADYSTMAWQLLGPLNQDQSLTFANLGGQYMSGTGNIYVGVLAYNGNSVTVNSATVHYDDGQTGGANYLDDLQPLIATNCSTCHGAGSFTGVDLHAFWAVRENQGKLVAKVVDGSHGSLDQAGKDTVQSFVDGDGQYGQAITWDNNIGPLTQMRCSPCHTGGNTSGGVSWDTYASAFTNGDNGLVQILSENMPRSGGPLNDDQKDIWQAWVDQGKPE